MKSPINIVFTINDSYAQHCCVTIVSILKNNNNSLFNFYIITDFFSKKNKTKFTQTIKKLNSNSKIHFIIIRNDLFKGFKINIDYISIQTYYRYIIPTLLDNVSKVIYLDSDIIVNGDINELWNTKLIEGSVCLGVKDLYIENIKYKGKIGLPNNSVYINAGVLVMDLNIFRKENITKKLINETINNNYDFLFQDQDIINIVLMDRIQLVSEKYNFTTENAIYKDNSLKPIILHFTGSIKPWSVINKCRNPYRNLYFKYLLMSPYKNYIYKYIYKRLIRNIKKLLGFKL